MRINKLSNRVITELSTQQLSVLVNLDVRPDIDPDSGFVRAKWQTKSAHYTKFASLGDLISSVKVSLNLHLREHS